MWRSTHAYMFIVRDDGDHSVRSHSASCRRRFVADARVCICMCCCVCVLWYVRTSQACHFFRVHHSLGCSALFKAKLLLQLFLYHRRDILSHPLFISHPPSLSPSFTLTAHTHMHGHINIAKSGHICCHCCNYF